MPVRICTREYIYVGVRAYACMRVFVTRCQTLTLTLTPPLTQISDLFIFHFFEGEGEGYGVRLRVRVSGHANARAYVYVGVSTCGRSNHRVGHMFMILCYSTVEFMYG